MADGYSGERMEAGLHQNPHWCALAAGKPLLENIE